MPSSAETPVIQRLRQAFEQLYGCDAARVFRAPGRVNLIGEHTDYNDGFVMPAAIGLGTYVAVAPRSDRKLRVCSLDLGEGSDLDLDALAPGPSGHWSDYVRGVAAVLHIQLQGLLGANLMVLSEVPLGAGLSSSAALEVSTALALLANSGLTQDRLSIALVCQKAEHQYAGTLCGIMDQFVACFGQENHALLLDCRSLQSQALTLDEGLRLVICNTKVKHDLAAGEYNLRRADCEEGVRYLKKLLPGITALRDVTLADLDRCRENMSDVVYRRCRHVVTENVRVLAAAEALRSSDLGCFGALMAESHRSLRDDYQVSCRELDLMVELALSCRGVYGARMTGGGFGGCTINLVRAEDAAAFQETIERKYERATAIRPDVLICTAAAGAGEVSSQRQP